MREPRSPFCGLGLVRYTLTYNEGTLSVYAAFSRLKHLVVQIAQMSFWSLISISNMPEIVTIGAIFLVFLASFFYLP